MAWRVVVTAAAVAAALVVLAAVAVNPSLLWWVAAGLLIPFVVTAVQASRRTGSRAAEYAIVVALMAVVAATSLTFLGTNPMFVAQETEPATFSVDGVLLEDDSGSQWRLTTRLNLEADDLDRAMDAVGADSGDGWAKMTSDERRQALALLEPSFLASGFAVERNRDTSVVLATQEVEPVGAIGWPPQHKWAADTTIRVNTPTVGDLLFEPDDKSVVTLLTECHALVNVRPSATSNCVDGKEELVVSLDRGGPVESTEVNAKVVAALLRYPGVNVAAVAPFQWWAGGVIALVLGGAGLALKDVVKDWWKSVFKKDRGGAGD